MTQMGGALLGSDWSGAGSLWELLSLPGLVFSSMFVTWLILRLRARRLNQVLLEDTDPAFTEVLSVEALRAAPEEHVSRLRGKIAGVVATSITLFQEGTAVTTGIAGTVYTSFIIDTNQETHDLESSEDADQIVANARWVAELFGVPFDSRAPGSVADTPGAPVSPSDLAYEASHRRRQRVTGLSLLLVGVGMWVGGAWSAWEAWVAHEAELAEHTSQQNRFGEILSQRIDESEDPEVARQPEDTDIALDFLFQREPSYDPGLSPILFGLAGLCLVSAGIGMLKRG